MRDFLNKLIKQGKLKLVEPSEEIKESYFEKSESNLVSSKLLLENNRLEEAVALSYYSMYNMALALFFKIGIKCENHSAGAVLLKKIFGFDEIPLVNAKKERIDKQYYSNFNITKKEVEKGIVSAENFNNNLRNFISELNNQSINDFRNKFIDLLKEAR